MGAWLVRGIGMTIVHVAVRVLLGVLLVQWPLEGTLFRISLLILVILVALAWGFLDGRSDRRRYPGEDEGADLTVRWLKAALLGGLLSGVVSWIIGLVPGIDVGNNPLFFELTSGAAWTMLLIFIPATVGMAIGRWLVNRAAKKKAEKSEDRDSEKREQRRPVGAGVGAGGSRDSDSDESNYYRDSDYRDDDSESRGSRSTGYDDPTESFDQVQSGGRSGGGAHARQSDRTGDRGNSEQGLSGILGRLRRK